MENKAKETIVRIVDRVTYHNKENGYSVRSVSDLDNPNKKAKVIAHLNNVYAGATLEFEGEWVDDKKWGLQFEATKAIEVTPSSTTALKKFLASDFIKGVGPTIAQRIVDHFGEKTIEILDNDIDRLKEIEGIGEKKLETIKTSWIEHKKIKDIMIFLQSIGLSTLFAVRIYKKYGENSILNVEENPYQLADDFFGIGFRTADKVALKLGIRPDDRKRIIAGIKYILSASRDFGHCYLKMEQIRKQLNGLLELDISNQLPSYLAQMADDGLIMSRELKSLSYKIEHCYYSKSLYFDEINVANRIKKPNISVQIDEARIEELIKENLKKEKITLSDEQLNAVKGILREKYSILTGGPGCGKTTTLKILVRLLEEMEKIVLLSAPTGRAAQRMSDVIGKKAKTIHRMLEWQMVGFKKNEDHPLNVEFLVVDESSMLDISLTSSLLKAVPYHSQVLFVGDEDQLPSVGPGNVLRDIIASGSVKCFRLTEIFRQAKISQIVQFAHQINKGESPYIDSPIRDPELWKHRTDCMFIDSDEATKEQLNFIARAKRVLAEKSKYTDTDSNLYEFRINEPLKKYETEINIPEKFRHVNLEELVKSETKADELRAVLKKVHPWSSLRYQYTASDIIKKLYLESIPKHYGRKTEIQILSPMTKGNLGTKSLNTAIQDFANPLLDEKNELKIMGYKFRIGDRVIHKRNNYELGVFNGEIGIIKDIDFDNNSCVVSFYPDWREIEYSKSDILELDLAYAITIHKSQGSEFETVILPVLSQHFMMLYRNLIYTGLTRAKKLAVLVGTRKALAIAVKNQDTRRRQTYLKELLCHDL